jgi:pentose-5-phosphate-3-epimerase
VKISASIYSGSKANILQEIKELDLLGVDYFHVDCNDDPSVFNEIEYIKSFSDKPIDLHIISPNPSQYYANIEKFAVEFVAFQYENIDADFELPKFRYTKVGLAIQANTPIEKIEKYLEKIDFLLFMTTTPGQSGGTFKKENFEIIRKIKKEHPKLILHVDGGVNNEVSFILRLMGVETAISGSYLMKHPSWGNALVSLKHRFQGSHFTVGEIMTPRSEIPVLNIENTNFYEILVTIENFKTGFCFFEDNQQNFKGVCANADIRKALIKNFDNIPKITVTDLINTKPITINEDKNIHQMLEIVKASPFLINFIPVIDQNNKLKGAVSFNQLIKGES